MDTNLKIKLFEEWYDLLMTNAPEGYVPWLFPCKSDKSPDGKYIASRAPKEYDGKKGSWEAPHARLTKEDAITFIKQGGNIGISARENDPLIIIDIDCEDKTQLMPSNSLITNSRKRIGIHGYYWTKDSNCKRNIPTEYGEMRCVNQYVLAPGSFVDFTDNDLLTAIEKKEIFSESSDKVKNDKLKGYYSVKEKIKPRYIIWEEIPDFFKNSATKEEESLAINEIKNEKREYINTEYEQLFKLKISDIIGNIPNNKRVGHPLHPSDTNANFSMANDGTVCHCWRHLVSLNAVQYLCVLSGKYNCEDAGKPHKGRGISKIKGDKEALKVALEFAKKLNLIKSKETTKTTEKKETKNKEDEDNTEYKSCLITENDIYEEIYDGKKCKFIKYNFETQQIDYCDEIIDNDIIIKPLTGEEIQKKTILLPKDVIEYNTISELDEQINKHVKKWLDVDETYRRFAVWNIRFSWVYDKFNTLNYTRALGDTGTGKSRFLNVLGNISYKPMRVSGALTSAPIFRIIDKWKGTLMIDEGDQKDSDESNSFIKILNCGYERGMNVMRCDKNDPKKLEFFEVFCPKVVTTRKRFEDKATEARCMTKIMTQTIRTDIPDILTEDYFREAEEIRGKLLLYRLRNYKKINPEAGLCIDLSKYEPRLRQVNRGFIGLFCNDEDEVKKFKDYLEEYQKEIIEERADSFDGGIVQSIAYLLANTIKEITPSEIAYYCNENFPSKFNATPVGIGHKLKSLGLTFKRERFGTETKNVLQLKNLDQIRIFLGLVDRYISDSELKGKITLKYGNTLAGWEKSVTDVLGVTDVTVVTTTEADLKNEKKIISDFEKKPTSNNNQNLAESPINHNNCNTVTDKTEENVTVEKVDRNNRNVFTKKLQIIKFIADNDKGDGVRHEEITDGNDEIVNGWIKDLIKEGEIFECRPCIYKVLQ